ncbi:MAG TPA: hypothetical protein ENN87_07730 [Phycisphaerales bacterium]|nr:hypothetical protein [Phycisphaerales bacterium]
MITETLILLVMAVFVLGPLVTALVADERPVEPAGPAEVGWQPAQDGGEAMPEYFAADGEQDGPNE